MPSITRIWTGIYTRILYDYNPYRADRLYMAVYREGSATLYPNGIGMSLLRRGRVITADTYNKALLWGIKRHYNGVYHNILINNTVCAGVHDRQGFFVYVDDVMVRIKPLNKNNIIKPLNKKNIVAGAAPLPPQSAAKLANVGPNRLLSGRRLL